MRPCANTKKLQSLNPSEENYFEWGSELLLHRAIWQAVEVLRRGADAYPRSARMQTALGTALFAGARYDQAAERFCAASDLNPEGTDPYVFMGKIQMAAPNPLACVKPRLARFVQQQPENSEANYLYAMSILKHQEQRPDEKAIQQAKALLDEGCVRSTQIAGRDIWNLASSLLPSDPLKQQLAFTRRRLPQTRGWQMHIIDSGWLMTGPLNQRRPNRNSKFTIRLRRNRLRPLKSSAEK